MIKLALAGKMGVGKTTAAEYLEQLGFKNVYFAKPLYEILKFAQQTCKFPFIKDRKFLQFVGTNWAREIDKDVWINLLLEETHLHQNFLVCSDVRFENEIDKLREDGWKIILISRNEPKNKFGHDHVSETSLNNIDFRKFDFFISNDETLESFFKKIDEMLFYFHTKKFEYNK